SLEGCFLCYRIKNSRRVDSFVFCPWSISIPRRARVEQRTCVRYARRGRLFRRLLALPGGRYFFSRYFVEVEKHSQQRFRFDAELVVRWKCEACGGAFDLSNDVKKRG